MLWPRRPSSRSFGRGEKGGPEPAFPAIGHLQSIKTMVENDRDCSEVLIQLAAVKSAVNNTGKLVLKEHIAHCIVEAIENGDEESLRQLNKAIDSFVK